VHSWIVTSEVNLVDWEEPRIAPVAAERRFYAPDAGVIQNAIVVLHERCAYLWRTDPGSRLWGRKPR
jgi:hypothetical protein